MLRCEAGYRNTLARCCRLASPARGHRDLQRPTAAAPNRRWLGETGETDVWVRCVQTEFKVMVTMVLSRLHVAVDAQRMPHLRTVEDYLADTITRVSLQRDAPAWLRMRPRVPAAA